ncbi:MAG TPA: type II secretion system F family protein [Bacteroidota bacterium]|nr:type II secretion system F family protein [Bacteroidota bacterium]
MDKKNKKEVTKKDSFTFLKRTQVTEKNKVEFSTQLAVMLQAGVSLHRSLEVLARQTKNERMKEVIEGLLSRIQRGESFAKALNAYPEVFDNLFVVTVEVGQESGRLPSVLAQLATHLEKINALKKKFRQALTYPALVLTVAIAAVLFLLLFIIPAFAEMFKTSQVEMPAMTKFVVELSDGVKAYGIYAVILLIVLGFAFRNFLKNPAVKAKLQSYLIRLPFFGSTILKHYVAQFCRTLGTLLEAQVSLVEALEVVQKMFTIEEIKNEIGIIIRAVKQGKAVAEPLVESKLFPPMVAQMITVGEETSELDTMLLKVADYYEKEIDLTVDTLSSIIEPVIILFLGLVVAFILISMYMPMFEVVGAVGG